MKLIFERDGVKREIEAPFKVCLSRDDAKELIAQLEQHLRDERWSSGWHTISPQTLVVTQCNTAPKAWTE